MAKGKGKAAFLIGTFVSSQIMINSDQHGLYKSTTTVVDLLASPVPTVIKIRLIGTVLVSIINFPVVMNLLSTKRADQID